MVDFNKKLKIDRINLFCDVVTKMANGTPAEVRAMQHVRDAYLGGGT